jgi:hypothetical protein
MKIKNIGISKLTFLLIGFFVYSSVLFNQRWKTDSVIANDVCFYYVYLPAAFIYHDLTFNYINDKLPPEVLNKSGRCTTEDGKHHYTKMACGYAIMLTPFFLTAHLLVTLFGEHANGYSYMYSMFICLATLIYFLIGLFYLRKTLLRFFGEKTTAYALLAIALATNLYTYTTYSLDCAHTFSFCAISIFIWLSIKWHEAPTFKLSILIGLLLGLITLIRPSNIVIIIFLMLYGIINRESFRNKIRMFWEHKTKVLIIVFCFFIGISPQLILWKIQTGQFIYYSYGDETFFFLHPHIFKGLFSFRNGLFIYTPILILAIPGLFFAWKNRKQFFIATLIFIAVNFYVVFSWWCWWYGGSFSIRPMIDSYALMGLPLGAFFQGFGRINNLTKNILISLLVIFILLNQFQTLQVQTGVMHYSDMTFNTYKKIFGRLAFPKGYMESLEHPDIDYAMIGLPERNYSDSFPFLNGGERSKVLIIASNGKYVCADHDRQGLMIANRDVAEKWEEFDVVMEMFARAKFISFENKYVCADPDSKNMLLANRDRPGEWELFWVFPLGNNKFALKTRTNKKFIKINPSNNNILEATSDSISVNETFEIIAQ